MNSKRPIRRRKLLAEINIVPYVDVTLVLLVVFMMTAPLQQRAVDVNLPIADGTPLDQKPLDEQLRFPVIISIQKDGQYLLSEKGEPPTVLLLDLLLFKVAGLHKTDPKTQFYVKADRDAHYGAVISVMEQLKKAGIVHVGLLTRTAEQ